MRKSEVEKQKRREERNQSREENREFQWLNRQNEAVIYLIPSREVVDVVVVVVVVVGVSMIRKSIIIKKIH